MERAAHAVVVHCADCARWHTLEQTESVQLTHAITNTMFTNDAVPRYKDIKVSMHTN